MDYVNLVRFDRIKDKITEVRNDNDARVRFVDLTTLKRRVRQNQRAVDQASDDPRSRRWAVLADKNS